VSTLDSAFATAALVNAAQNDEQMLFVLRHGESRGQKDIRLYSKLGDTRIPLTDLGYRQARTAGKTIAALLKLAGIQENPIIYSSTGERSLATGASMLHVLIRHGYTTPFIPDMRLDKQKFGKFDGLFTRAERKASVPSDYARYVEEEVINGAFYARPPEGESIADVKGRAHDFLTTLPRDRVPKIIVTHGTNALCLEADAAGYLNQWVLDGQDKWPNCGIHILTGNAARGYRAIGFENDGIMLQKSFPQAPGLL
jgi:2,3-bisphosphoglycerate-dependent phosphoglycerate mutase